MIRRQTLVLLPGMDGTGKLFTDFCASVDEKIRPRIISYPGDQVLNYRQLVDFVEKRVPHDEPFVLLGESFSGPIAIEVAAMKPPGLMGVVLCCSFAKNPLPFLALLRNAIPILPPPTRLVKLIARLAFGRFSTQHLIANLATALKDVSTEVLKARMRAALDIDSSIQLKNVEVPVLYLQAMEDRIVPASAMRYIRSALPALHLAKLHGPHFLLQAMPVESAKIIGDFVLMTTSMDNKSG